MIHRHIYTPLPGLSVQVFIASDRQDTALAVSHNSRKSHWDGARSSD